MKNRDDTYMDDYYDSEYLDEFDDSYSYSDESDYIEKRSRRKKDEDDYYNDELSGTYDDELDGLEGEYNDEDFESDIDDELFSEKVQEKSKKVESNSAPRKNVGRYASEKNAKSIMENGTSGTDVRSRFYSIVEDYHSGNPWLQQNAADRAIKELEGFIHTIIRRSYSTYTREYFNDLLQEGRLGVLVGLQKYDPSQSMPTTFFYPYIKHEMQNLITKQVDKTTTHYSTNIKKINKVIEEFEERNQPYTHVDIAIQTGMTIETVNQSMAIKNCRDEVYIDGCPPGILDNKHNGSKILTPEEQFFETEEKRIIHNTIDDLLTDMEIKVFEYHFGLHDVPTCSEGEIAKKLGIPKDKVKKLLNSAIRKLKHSDLKLIFRDHLVQDKLLIEEKEISFVNTELAEQDIGFLLDTIDTDDSKSEDNKE